VWYPSAHLYITKARNFLYFRPAWAGWGCPREDQGRRTTLGLIINSSCSLSLALSLTRSPTTNTKTEQCSQTTANGVPFSMRLLSLLLINFGTATYDCSYKSWWLSLPSNKYLDINIHNKAPVIHRRTMTYAAATKRRSDVYLHIRSETWFEKLDVMLTLPCIFPLNKFCTWKYGPRLHRYISFRFIQPFDI
jgi:hypothetical protein